MKNSLLLVLDFRGCTAIATRWVSSQNKWTPRVMHLTGRLPLNGKARLQSPPLTSTVHATRYTRASPYVASRRISLHIYGFPTPFQRHMWKIMLSDDLVFSYSHILMHYSHSSYWKLTITSTIVSWCIIQSSLDLSDIQGNADLNYSWGIKFS